MIICGVDVGSKTVKVVILDSDGKVLARAIELGGFDQKAASITAMEHALSSAGIGTDDLAFTVCTGAGKKDFPFEAGEVTEVTAAARAAAVLFPAVRTIIDVGAEEGRGIKTDASGRVVDFVVNEKCAAGSGSFTEAMSRALEVSLEELGRLSLESNAAVPMNAQCAVFAESEVVTLIHAKTPKKDISRAIHDAIASRIISMVRRIGVEEEVALMGGVAYNVGFVDSLERGLETTVRIPELPEYCCAFGAALIARERATA